MQRLMVSGSSLSGVDGTGWYTFPVNPIQFNDQNSRELEVGRTLNGYSFEMFSVFDGRIRTMEWNGIINKEPYITMMSNLEALRGKSGYIKIADLSGTEGNTTVQPIRIVNVVIVPKSGRGAITAQAKMVYESIILSYVHTS